MNESKATRYQRLSRRARAASVASGALLLVLLVLTPASHWIAEWARGVGDGLSARTHALVTLTAFVGLAVVLWEAVALPAVLYLGLKVDRRFRGADHSVESVLSAQAQATLVALPAAFVAAAVVVVSVHVAGPWWWTLAGALLALALVGALRAAPVLFLLVGEARPVDRPALVDRLADLARRAHVPIARVDEWRVGESAPTALVAGIGRTRRVLVSSDMLRHWSDDEIAVVVAHELGHHAHHDLWRTVALDVVVLSVALWLANVVLEWLAPVLALAGPGDLAALPCLALVAGGCWLVATPMRHAQSRAHEHRADQFALGLTGAADAFRAAIRRLEARHLVEERPSTLTRWLYHRHPSVAERLAFAEAFGKVDAGGPP
jgi:STE24 endopeptidase